MARLYTGLLLQECLTVRALWDVPVVRGVSPNETIWSWFQPTAQGSIATMEDPVGDRFACPSVEPGPGGSYSLHTSGFPQEKSAYYKISPCGIPTFVRRFTD
jgi:hypothetical protein